MRFQGTMMSVMLAAVVASPAMAGDVNPWRAHAPSQAPQSVPPQPAATDQGYRYAPLDNSIPPGRAQSQYMTMPYGTPNFVPQGGYRQNPRYGSGYANRPYLGGLGGYPGQGLRSPFGGPFGGYGPRNGGWNGMNNGFNNGPWSWMPFW